ncbi:MAG: site-specific integrase [Firmicutes bacterium]|nr:site-specific integrase [Bacillota bacterium]
MITKYGAGTLFGAIHDYLKFYLPKQRNMSGHTQNSYRKALELLVDFVKKHAHVPLQDVTFEMLTAETVTAFLDSLETERGNAISSRNTRLAAIRAFLKYAADRNVVNAAILQEMKNVALKKPDKVEKVDYMSMAAVAAIVDQTDLSAPLGLRDRAMLILLYDTGARVQELIDIKLCDLRFGRTPTVTLHGKGGKVRSVPLLERTAQYLNKYLLEFHSDVPKMSGAPLFYTVSHGERHPLTDRRVRYLLKDYADKARQSCLEVPENVHPHMIRHSRAMHLYQNGMDLTLVSEWLGHANLETTQIYAHADTEHKRAAIANATPENSLLFSKLNPERLTISDEDMLKRLIGLRN